MATPLPPRRPATLPRRRALGLILQALAGLLAGFAHGPVWAARRPAKVAPPPASSFQRALATALNGQPWQPSDALRMDIPQLAENGAIVPVTVESLLPDTRRLLIFAEHNPGPLLAEFHFEPNTDPWISLRLKLNATGPVLAIAEAGGQFYGAQTVVKVMIGGCG